jgi:hypothetical protein
MKIFIMRNCTSFLLFLVFVSFVNPIASKENSKSTSEDLFEIICPPNVTIQCGDDIFDLDQYGTAHILTHQGSQPAPSPTVFYNLNDCGLGIIVRTWSAHDYNWNWVSCSQVIHVVGGGLQELNILWPPDYTFVGCEENIDPSSLPFPHNRPIISDAACSHPGVSYKDWVFTMSDGCKKVLRMWKVIDFCVWKPNTGSDKGVFTYNQSIKIVTSGELSISCPEDIVVGSGGSCEGAFVQIPEAIASSDCPEKAIRISYEINGQVFSGADASGFFPVGTSLVKFTAHQTCGQTATCTVRVSVVLEASPSVICRDEIIAVLMGVDTNGDGEINDGKITLPASLFNKGSVPSCNGTELTFSWSSDPSDQRRTFTCQDVGYNPVSMYVTDNFGNQSFCNVTLVIQNNSNIPDCFPDPMDLDSLSGQLGGFLVSADNYPILNAFVEISSESLDTLIATLFDTLTVTLIDTLGFDDLGNPIIQIVDTQIITPYQDTSFGSFLDTLIAGVGSFGIDSLPRAPRYKVRPFKMDLFDHWYVNFDDVRAIIRHLNGSSPFDSPYKLLAADVNLDKEITQRDIFIVSNKASKRNEYDSIPLTWHFIPQDFLFEDPLNPFLEDSIPEFVWVDSAQLSYLEAHFYGYKLGDVDLSGFDRRSNGIHFVEIMDRDLESGVPYEFYLDLPYVNILYYQLSLMGDMTSLIVKEEGANTNLLEDNGKFYLQVIPSNNENGNIKVEFTPLRDGKMSELLWLCSDSENVVLMGEEELQTLELRFFDEVSKSRGVSKATVYPNPFFSETQLEFQLSEATWVDLRIYSLDGKEIYKQKGWYEKGYNRIFLSENHLPNSGMYLYELSSLHNRERGKIIKVK